MKKFGQISEEIVYRHYYDRIYNFGVYKIYRFVVVMFGLLFITYLEPKIYLGFNFAAQFLVVDLFFLARDLG